MKRNIWLIPAFMLVLAVGFFMGRAGEDHAVTDESSLATEWTCSMHPQIRAPEFGSCPICGMDLIEAVGASASTVHQGMQLSEHERALARVQTQKVQRRAVERELRLFGTLSVPETAQRTVTARIEGRIEKVHVDQDGAEVRAGMALVDFYSPGLYAAQQEFLDARRRGGHLADAARERLIAWGLSEDQVDQLAESGIARDVVTLRAPQGGVVLRRDVVEGTWVKVGASLYEIAPLDPLWLKLEIYESQLAGVREGNRLSFQLQAFPGEEFSGEIDFMSRVVDTQTHAVFARVVVPNPDRRLRPGMFVRAELHVPVEGEDLPLVIPVSAPLITGERAVVYVEKPGHAGEYTARVIELGLRAGDYYVVRSGLSEGEIVVSRGAFRIDSSLQIEGGPSMMDAPAQAHRHEGGS